MQKILFACALVLGLTIGYLDSRPNWDDTCVTAFAVLLSAGVLGFLGPQRPWLWALAIGLGVPLFGIANGFNFASLLALLIAFAGAYAGMGLRRVCAFAVRDAT